MRRKKCLYLAGVLVLAAGLLAAGCSKKEDPAKPAATSASGDKKVITWRLQSCWPPPEKVMGYLGGYGQAMEIARKVKERTNGGLDIKVFQPDALFKSLEAPEAVKKGAIEMVCSSGAYHIGILPEALLEWGLPYGTRDSKQAAKLYLETDYIKILRQAYAEKHNAYLLGVCTASTYNYITKFPVKSMADLKGKQIRATGTAALIAKAHGAVPVNIAASEQYMALQRGTVDGTIFPPYAGISYKFFEVARYQLWPPIYSVSTFNFVANMDAWKSLPKEYQDILQDEVNKMVRYSFEVSGPALEKIAIEEGKKQFNSESITLSDEEYEKFREAVMPLWDEWGQKSDYCAKLVKIAKDNAGVK